MPTTNGYDIGDRVTLEGTFRDAAGAVIDPTAVVCKLKQPGLAAQALTVVKQSVGVYQATFDVLVDGDHWYRFEGTGAAVAAGENYFRVRAKRVA